MATRLHRRLVEWLNAYRRKHATWCLAGAIGVALLAAVAWFLTFWAIKFVLWVGFSWVLATPFLQTLGVLGVCGLVVVAHRRANWEQIQELKTDHPALAGSLQAAAWITGDALFVLAGPKTFSSFVKVWAMITLTAPRLTQLSWELYRRSQTAAGMDVEACAVVLATLLKSDRKVPLDELIQKAPDLDWRRVLREVTVVDGVQVRLGDDPLVSIADSEREEITNELESMPGS